MFLVTLVSIVATAAGQTPYFGQLVEPEATYKFSEFVHSSEDGWKSQLNDFASVRKVYPDASLSVRVYARPGEPRKSAEALKKQYKEYFRKIDSKGVLAGTGGYRRQITTELWVIGKDGLIPQPSPDEPFVAEKADEIGEVTRSEFDERIQRFWNLLIDEGETAAYIVNYGTASQIAKRETDIQNSLSRRHLPRITVVRVDNADGVNTVLWLVPPTAENPPINE